MQIVLWVSLGVVGLLFLMSLLQRLVLKGMRGPLSSRISKRYPDEQVVLIRDLEANSFGLKSWGKFQRRGNGALVLTRDELCFFQFMPNRDFVIPLRQVTEVSFTRTHLGKATLYRLLHILFEVEGRPDSIAIFVKNPDDFRKRIEQARESLKRTPEKASHL